MSIIIMLNLQITDTFVIYPAVVFLVSILFNMTDWLSSRFYEEGSTETRLNICLLSAPIIQHNAGAEKSELKADKC